MEDTMQLCITVPTPEGLQKWALFVLDLARETSIQHPYPSAAFLLLLSYHPELPFKFVYYVVYGGPKAISGGILTFLGFTPQGIGRDTYASRYQSQFYQGYVPEDSWFSEFQSRDSLAKGGPKKRGIIMSTLGWAFMIASVMVLLAE